MSPARLWLIVVIALGATLCARDAAAAAPAEMEAFVSDVLARNPSLRAGALRTQALRQEASAADLWPDPSLRVMVDQVPGYEGGEMPMIQYQLSQMIPWPGKLGLMRGALERQGDAAAAEVDRRRIDLALAARRAYVMLLLNARLRQVNAAARALVGDVAAIALTRYSTGAGGHHEVTRAQVEQAALDVEALNLEGERASAVAMLNGLRDRPPAAPIADPPEALESPPVKASPDALAERAIKARPELKAMLAMRREAETMGDLARRERYPDLMASVWYNQMLGEPDSAGLMVGVTLPVFGIARQGRRASAWGSRARSAGEEAAAMRAMIRAEIADAYQKVLTASRELELLRGVALPRAMGSYESSLAAYVTGVLDILGVLEARRALQATQRAIVTAQARREVALAELRRAAGGSLEEGP